MKHSGTSLDPLYSGNFFFVHRYSSHVPDPIAFYSYSMAKQRKVILCQKCWLGKVLRKPLDLHFTACRISKGARTFFENAWHGQFCSGIPFCIYHMILATFESTTRDSTMQKIEYKL